jgi:adenine-specific DNA-methyltransferase
MSIAQPLGYLKPVHVQNRKYIGSKYHLLEFIAGVVASRAPKARSLGDLFCGSGVVAHHFAAQGLAVTAVDTLYHNAMGTRCFIGGRLGEVDWGLVAQRITHLNGLPGEEGYCWQEFGGTYFTAANAARIDAVREQIAHWSRTAVISEQEEAVLLTSLLYAVDKVANTCGQYDAFLKHLGAEPYSAQGVHRVDAMVYRPLLLGIPQAVETGGAKVLWADVNEVIDQVECDVLYLDPPYNGRQYVDNYHVLENIARWEKPALSGKTRKFERQHLKSDFSRKREAEGSLGSLVSRARCRHILLSYNNEGIVADEAILRMLQRRGPTEVFSQEYAIFGNGAGRSGRRPIQERLFYCRVKHSPAD